MYEIWTMWSWNFLGSNCTNSCGAMDGWRSLISELFAEEGTADLWRLLGK